MSFSVARTLETVLCNRFNQDTASSWIVKILDRGSSIRLKTFQFLRPEFRIANYFVQKDVQKFQALKKLIEQRFVTTKRGQLSRLVDDGATVKGSYWDL